MFDVMLAASSPFPQKREVIFSSPCVAWILRCHLPLLPTFSTLFTRVFSSKKVGSSFHSPKGASLSILESDVISRSC
ncbi:TPA: hypothetical protein DIC40_01710 [Patescibacteria group bacterium]|nr:hypothetical protein [Candidatus Gracilibacteria bacterium]